jgi:hypothetical protein
MTIRNHLLFGGLIGEKPRTHLGFVVDALVAGDVDDLRSRNWQKRR